MLSSTRRDGLSLLWLILLSVCSSLQPIKPTGNAISEFTYALHWETLLLEEYQETAAELRERRKSWSRRRLEESGLAIFDACAEPESDVLGEKIVRIFKQGETKFGDRFTKGDVLLMTSTAIGYENMISVPRECLVVDVGKDWLSVGVGPSWPKGLYEARKHPGFYRVRVDRAAPQGPLKFQRMAFDLLKKGMAGTAANLLVKLYNTTDSNDLASKRPQRFDSDLDMETTIKEALDKATNITTFTPNESQQEAIIWALKRRLSLIRGPPGTGKTRTAALLISTAIRLQQGSDTSKVETPVKPRVLAVTHSNGAADVLLEALLQMGVPAVRLGRPAAVSSNVQHRTIVAMAEKMPEVVRLRQMAGDVTLDSQTRTAAAFDLKQYSQDVQSVILDSAPVVVASCIGAHQLFSAGDSDDLAFPIVVLDEAAQTTEPALVCALAASKAEQLVLVGDTRQLPPTVTSIKLRDSLGVSPMSRLEKNGVDEFTLRVQYRMSPGLLEHPSAYFYKGLIRCADDISTTSHEPPAGFPWPNKQPIAFLQVGNDSEVAHNFGGRSNPTEAKLVAQIVSNLIKAGEVTEKEISVISPYAKQVQLIRTELSSSFFKGAQNVRVGTVDSFQGQEKEVIIFSSVRSNPLNELGFLRDSRRLCVALTRAKRGLILVGDSSNLKTCRHWMALLESCEKRGCMLMASDLLEPSLRQKDHDPHEAIKKHEEGNDEIDGLFAGIEDEFGGLFTTKEDKQMPK